MTRAELRSQLVEVAGLDLTDSEANSLINEGYRELCVQSEWTRAFRELGPGVDGQPDYDMPANVHRILKMSVDGQPLTPADEETGLQLARGDATTTGPLWWISFTDDGTEKITVYPEMSGGESILAYCVVYPADLTDDAQSPVTPRSNGDRAILNFCQAQVLGNSEDDVQTRDYYLGEFARLTAEVRGLRFSRVSRHNMQVRILGVNA